MKLIDLTIPLGIGTPPWPTYEPLQVKYFKRLSPNGANGQLLTHSNHLGTHLDGEIEQRVEVREGDILIIHTGYHHFGWDQPYADEIRYMVQHPGPDREFAVWAKEKKIKWIGVDCGSADHPMNTIIRDWMPRQAAEADKVFQEMYGATLAERFTPDKYQLMHIEMFPHHIIHAECVGGDIDLLCNRRTTIGFFPWRFVDGESSIGRCVAMVNDDEYEELMAQKAALPKTRFGDGYNPEHVEHINGLTRRV
jgi:arylformamidase